MNEQHKNVSSLNPAQTVAGKETGKELAETNKIAETSEKSEADATAQSTANAAGQDLPDTIPFAPVEHPAPLQSPPTSPVRPLSVPPAISDSPTSNWYVRPTTGGQYGPATGIVVWQWVLENRIGPDSLVWREDWKEWQTAAAAFQGRSGAENLKPPAPPHAPVLPQQTASKPPLISATTSTIGQVAKENDSAGLSISTSLGQKNRDYRKKQKRRKYLILVISLVIIFLILLIGLIVVLWRQYA